MEREREETIGGIDERRGESRDQTSDHGRRASEGGTDTWNVHIPPSRTLSAECVGGRQCAPASLTRGVPEIRDPRPDDVKPRPGGSSGGTDNIHGGLWDILCAVAGGGGALGW